MVKDVHVVFEKGRGSQQVPNDENGHAPMWKKKSILWELPYYDVLEVRNAIDVMHLTKNLLREPARIPWYVWAVKRYTRSKT